MHRLTKWRFELNHYCGSDETSSLSLHNGVCKPTISQSAEKTLEIPSTCLKQDILALCLDLSE
jgi:hypothetical protein